ncbi:MAG: PAS domain-containing sensor histidine kinase [Bdellovibrio sp.]|nr:MAG: PAS domain-containing sensor histidine kinase [Bdellovibrio sp.]
MIESDDDLRENSAESTTHESRKRKREVIAVFFLATLFFSLTWFEVRLFQISHQLPFVHSIFFFGLVNFNIILLLLLLFLIFRNVVKVFVERRGRIFGSSLKAKLIAAFVAFSFIPTTLIFLTSVFYINSSFEKWFSVKMGGVLKSSLEVTNAYYFNAKKRNYHFAHEIAGQLRHVSDPARIKKKLEALQKLYALDALEYYPSLFGRRILAVSDDETIPVVPKAPIEFLDKGIRSQVDGSVIHQFGEGNLVRVIVPVEEGRNRGAVIVSSFVPMSLISKMNDISNAYDEFRDVNPLEYPLKSIYLIMLVLMTLVVLLAATWFGFYLAKQLSVPLVQLGRATKRIAGGDYAPVEIITGSEEIASLVDSFNQMTLNLSNSEREVLEANIHLRRTLGDLDKHNRYIEVVLGSVSAGVISVDRQGIITTLNKRAGELLHIPPDRFIGRSVRELLTLEYFRIFADLLKSMQEHRIESIQKELTLDIQGESTPFQMTLSILKSDQGEDIGKILVFDDMTPIVSAQRAAAWSEVARRIAHEIKNPLTPIKLSAERLQRKFGEQIQDPAFKECTSMIVTQTEGLKNLVNEFTQFARLPQAKPVLGDLNHVIAETLPLYTSSHPQVKMRFEPDPHLPKFKFDQDQLRRVLVNLFDNAIAALNQEPTKEVLVQTRFDRDLRILKVNVVDNGCGIPPAQRARVFEPYFSTKDGGTGLGLAIVKRIVEDHNGFIRALPNSPRGTRMVIEMPIPAGEAVVETSEKARLN